ncbi:MAG: N-acetylglucosamine kinase [Cohaesibacter sp.]|nr:N-acetylglucosamine kinase [Cohaesibacter sp.]
MTAGSYFVGIDGGGTNCRGRLRSAQGLALGEAMGGPANTRLGVEAAQQQVLSVCVQTLKAASLVPQSCVLDDEQMRALLAHTHLGVGLAGLHLQSQLEAFLNWDHPFASLDVCNDAHIACLGAHGGVYGDTNAGADAQMIEAKGILILGTGSCGYGFKEGRAINVGGWGFRLSDMASGAVTGYLAVRHALAVLDQIYPTSPLSEEILQPFSHDAEKLVLWSDGAKPADYGQIAKLVVAHACAGDEAALGLMRDCAAQAEAMLRALAAKGIEAVSLVGGFAEHVEPFLSEDLRSFIVPRLYDARDGAILLAGGRIEGERA